MNIPYTKEYNEVGEVSNPITYKFIQPFPNRKARRMDKNEPRFRGNNKGHNLTVGPKFKYRRCIQLIGDKQIEHYYLVK